jgi:hypothetical protein
MPGVESQFKAWHADVSGESVDQSPTDMTPPLPPSHSEAGTTVLDLSDPSELNKVNVRAGSLHNLKGSSRITRAIWWLLMAARCA